MRLLVLTRKMSTSAPLGVGGFPHFSEVASIRIAGEPYSKSD